MLNECSTLNRQFHFFPVIEWADSGNMSEYLEKKFKSRKPFEYKPRNMELCRNINRGEREILVKDTLKSFIQLYETCWHTNPILDLQLLKSLKGERQF